MGFRPLLYDTISVMISVVVLTHNSASSLTDTLQSLSWCDERVIIDDNSTDSTVKIAQTYDARVVTHALKNDFAKQRNFGLEIAKGDWVLFVDADEVVSKKLADELVRAAKDPMKDGYYLRRDDTIWGQRLRHGETRSVRLVRFGRKGSGTWTRPVHEVWDIHGYLGTIHEPILHFPHPDVAQFLADINAYSTANAQYLYTQGVRSHGIHILAYPGAKFVMNYFVRKGFLDGTAGMIVALMMSFHSFLTRAKLWQLWHRQGTS